MTFSNPDSLQVRMHSYPFIVSLCFSHHFSFFVILSFTIKIMFYFLPLKKKVQSFLLISTLKDHMVISIRCVMPWFHPLFSSPEVSEPFSSLFYSIEPTMSITILIHICLRLKIRPLSSPSTLVACPYHNSQIPLLNYFLSLASETSAALSFHISLANYSVSLYFQESCMFTHDCVEFWFCLLSLLCTCLCLGSLIH